MMLDYERIIKEQLMDQNIIENLEAIDLEDLYDELETEYSDEYFEESLPYDLDDLDALQIRAEKIC